MRLTQHTDYALSLLMALAVFLSVLDGYTLADLICHPGQSEALRKSLFPPEDSLPA